MSRAGPAGRGEPGGRLRLPACQDGVARAAVLRGGSRTPRRAGKKGVCSPGLRGPEPPLPAAAGHPRSGAPRGPRRPAPASPRRAIATPQAAVALRTGGSSTLASRAASRALVMGSPRVALAGDRECGYLRGPWTVSRNKEEKSLGVSGTRQFRGFALRYVPGTGLGVFTHT